MKLAECLQGVFDKELNIAICEWRRWKFSDDGDVWYHPDYEIEKYLPNHITGIEALGHMHEAEKGLNWFQHEQMMNALLEHVAGKLYSLKFSDFEQKKMLFTATARQRAIALLLVVRPKMFQK